MPLFADRVMETTTTAGTGTLTLAGAVSGYRAFSTPFVNGDRVKYARQSLTVPSEWEVGDGIYSAGTITRENVYSSSNSDALVSFSAGTSNVWCDLPAASIADMGLALAFKNNVVPQ